METVSAFYMFASACTTEFELSVTVFRLFIGTSPHSTVIFFRQGEIKRITSHMALKIIIWITWMCKQKISLCSISIRVLGKADSQSSRSCHVVDAIPIKIHCA